MGEGSSVFQAPTPKLCGCITTYAITNYPLPVVSAFQPSPIQYTARVGGDLQRALPYIGVVARLWGLGPYNKRGAAFNQ